MISYVLANGEFVLTLGKQIVDGNHTEGGCKFQPWSDNETSHVALACKYIVHSKTQACLAVSWAKYSKKTFLVRYEKVDIKISVYSEKHLISKVSECVKVTNTQ